MTTGDKLRQIRLSKGYTMAYIAKVSGYSVQSISAIERGENPPGSINRLMDISDALGVPGLDVLGDDLLKQMLKGLEVTRK